MIALTPLPPAGMAVGAQVAQPQPAAVVTGRMRTKVPRGVDGPWAAVGRGQRIGSYRRRWRGRRRLLGTQGTERLARQAAKRLRLLVAWTSGRARRSGPQFLRPTGAWPYQRQHDKQPQESQDDELIIKEVWNHGSTPLHGNVTGHCTRFPDQANYPQPGGTYMDPPALSRGSRVKKHASEQMQSYIRPLGEDLL